VNVKNWKAENFLDVNVKNWKAGNLRIFG